MPGFIDFLLGEMQLFSEDLHAFDNFIISKYNKISKVKFVNEDTSRTFLQHGELLSKLMPATSQGNLFHLMLNNYEFCAFSNNFTV